MNNDFYWYLVYMFIFGMKGNDHTKKLVNIVDVLRIHF